MIRWAGRAFAAWLTSRADLIAENLCLRQQLVGLQRRRPRPRLRDGDRLFWILACRWVPRWREFLLVVQPATVLGWHRRGWTAYWRWRSRRRTSGGRPRIAGEVRALIRRMASENSRWGHRRGQAELARLGFTVSARTVATYMRRPYDGAPSPSWRDFLTRHAKDIWACDFFSVRTIFFQTLDVFFVMHHETRQLLQVRVARHPTAEGAAQQVVDVCGWGRDPARYLIRDRDGRFGIEFDRRVQRLGVTRIRTPRRAPRANALAERWVRSERTECLDHRFIINEHHLQRVLDEYVVYFNAWRPHRGLGQRASCGSSPTAQANPTSRIVGRPVLGGLHHVYQHAACALGGVVAPCRVARPSAAVPHLDDPPLPVDRLPAQRELLRGPKAPCAPAEGPVRVLVPFQWPRRPNVGHSSRADAPPGG
jgi:putative transposase